MSNKILEVYDDWCDQRMFDYIENLLLIDNIDTFPFRYVRNVTWGNHSTDKYEYAPGFSCQFWPNVYNLRHLNTINQILTRFCEYRELSFENILAARSFIHLPSGVNKRDPIHVDNPWKHYALLYYVNDSEGDTTFFEDDEVTEIKKVSPKKGRVAFFDGSIKHCSSTPISKTRCVINFNFTTN